MPTTDYRQGYRDGFADGLLQHSREQEALNGPDRTMYQFIGGPKHGERVETGGVRTVVAPIIPTRCYHYADRCNGLMQSMCEHICCRDSVIQTGWYEKSLTSRGVTVYRWKG